MIIQLNEGDVEIPPDLKTLDVYREWAKSLDYPTRGRFSFFQGELWMELEKERLFSHNRIKLRIGVVLEQLAADMEIGYVFTDRAC